MEIKLVEPPVLFDEVNILKENPDGIVAFVKEMDDGNYVVATIKLHEDPNTETSFYVDVMDNFIDNLNWDYDDKKDFYSYCEIICKDTYDAEAPMDLSKLDEIMNTKTEKRKKEPPRRKNDLKSKIIRFLENTSFKEFVTAIEERVKGQKELINILANVYNYLSNLAYERPVNNNMILAAPSGCGKTETFRALKEYFSEHLYGLPVYQVDVSSITEEGIVGDGVSAIIEPLFETGGCIGEGIVFLDEFDKKLIPSYVSLGSDMNSAVQSQLLTIVEGREFQGQYRNVDTSKTMFIGLGSFDVCRQDRQENQSQPMGFGTEGKTSEVVKHYDPITREDMINLGAIYELIGRFPMVVNYYELSADVINQIIDGMLDKISNSIGAKVEISDVMRQKLHNNANGHYGCRILYGMIHQAVITGYAKLMYNSELDKVCAIVLEDENKVSFRKKRKRRLKA